VLEIDNVNSCAGIYKPSLILCIHHVMVRVTSTTHVLQEVAGDQSAKSTCLSSVYLHTRESHVMWLPFGMPWVRT